MPRSELHRSLAEIGFLVHALTTELPNALVPSSMDRRFNSGAVECVDGGNDLISNPTLRLVHLCTYAFGLEG